MQNAGGAGKDCIIRLIENSSAQMPYRPKFCVLSPRWSCVQSNLIKGRIAAAHRRKSLYFTMGCPFPQNCPFTRRSGANLIHDSLGPLGPHPKRYHNRGFCRVHDRDRQTDRPTNRQGYSVCKDRLHLRTYSTAMRHKNRRIFLFASQLT